jgi:hypothetical protein
MLLANGKISQEALDELVMTDSEDDDFISKTLVEKGYVSLKELINLTKIQLERIIYSVLRYRDGEYQFVQDQPPKRLLSLDVDITSFIRNFILDEVTESDIWKELESPENIFIRNEELPAEKFNFSKKQIELLDSFQGGHTLGQVMDQYSSAHKNSLLKIIYFFALADLIVPEKDHSPAVKEFEESASATLDSIMDDSEEESDFPPLEGENYTLGNHGDFPAEENTGEVEIDLEPVTSPPDTGPVDIPSPTTLPNPSAEDLLREEEKRHSGRRRWIFAGVLVLVLAALGLTLYFSGQLDSFLLPDNRKSLSGQPAEIVDTGSSVKPEQLTPDPQTTLGKTLETENSPESEPQENPVEKPETGTDQSESPSPDTPDEEAPPNPRRFLEDGDLKEAAKIWKTQLQRENIRFSILLELDCLQESVLKAFQKMDRNPDFFILSQPRENRTCYLVLYGRFQDENQAEKALQDVPDYFFLQQNPPVITEITRYLK